ncbi:hypothetical protein [Pseudooceanicola sp.]|uniref:hypothetical protein n=1 Tax=Pseudooceanicola sp. TaxID=1914328 RepID=UPI00262E268E|nr:hypothetical protein [Pseudooceanicola sp.]MDF1854504.1 hypothetical protein [Pseudooceanicola sp.]
MTALSEYQRLEARGLWRERAEDQRREVVASLGDATLVLTDTNDRALAHWSLAAVIRLNPGELPAIYSPDGLDQETLELPADETVMVAAIEKVRRAIENRRPHPGRLRIGVLGATAVGLALLAVFWLPGALENHALSVVPEVKRVAIGEALLERIRHVAGAPCDDIDGRAALARLAARLPGPNGSFRIHVMRDGVRGAILLPGDLVLLNRTVVEDTSDPDVVAGYVIVADRRARERDPLGRLLAAAGPLATLRLLTTGVLSDEVIESYARSLLTTPQEPLSNEDILSGFRDHGVRATPYAYALDITGESTIGLIEADPYPTGAPVPVLVDADWLRLQAICE